jgi:hypothetical protein
MRLKFNGLLALFAVVGMVSAGEFTDVTVSAVFLENEAKFSVQFTNSPNAWYVVNETSFNASSSVDRFNQIHALCVAALNSGKKVDVGYTGTGSPFTITRIKIRR